MDYLTIIYVLFMSVACLLILKGAYDIYWTGEKVALKEKSAIKYGLPLLTILFILPFLVRYLLSN